MNHRNQSFHQNELDSTIELARYKFETELQRYLAAIRASEATPLHTCNNPFSVDKLNQELQEMSQWLRGRFNEFMKLLEISNELNKVLLLDDILQRIYTFFQDVIPYERIGCALIDEGGESVTAYWAQFTYQEQPKISKGYSAKLAGSSLETIMHSGEPRILNDLEAYLAENPQSDSTRRIVAEGIRSSLTCPLIAEGKPVGFLFFSSREKNTYAHLHQEIFLYIAAQVAQIIEKSRLYQQIMDLNQELQDAYSQLQEKAERDALTGLYNRGAILEHFSQQLSNENSHPVAIIIADIDHFKHFNDTYGHVNGDLVLRKTAEAFRQNTPQQGRSGRFGGEEFLVVLSNCALAKAVEVAEAMRQSLAEQRVTLSNQQVTVTASFGVATAHEISTANVSNVLELADQRLYQAKRNGRNQVCSQL